MRTTFIRTAVVALFLLVWHSAEALSQARVGFISSSTIRERFGEAVQAQQRLQSITEEWKRELDERQKKIDELKDEISKKRLIWSDQERRQKEELLDKWIKDREAFAKEKFGDGGEFDKRAADILTPIEGKIYAAVQEVAFAERVDIVWDKSTQPLVFANPRNDLTIKVMEKLGINVEDLKAKQEKLIESLPTDEPKTRQAKPKRRAAGSKASSEEEKKDGETTSDPSESEITPATPPTTPPRRRP